MTNGQLLEAVATTTGQNKDTIKNMVAVYTKSGQFYIYGKTMPYWLRDNDTFAIVADDYQVDLRDEFPDFLRLKYLRTVNQMIKPTTGEAYHRDHPDDTGTGEPDHYFPLDKDTIQLTPRSDGSYTVYVSYYYRPTFDSIEDTPIEWRHVILHYVLMMFDPEKWTSIFYDSLRDFVAEAKFAVEDDVEIMMEDLHYSIKDTSDNLRR